MRAEAADPVDREVGARIRAARLKVGLTQSQLAAAVGLSFQQVQKYESGANRVSASTLVRLARALNTTVIGLFPDPDTPAAVDVTNYPDGADLAESFAAMSPARRTLLVEIARTFAEAPGSPRKARTVTRRSRAPRREA